jgi:hypothetical protein
MTAEPTGGAFYAKEPLSSRLWCWLGYGWARAPRPDEDELIEGWAPGWFIVETRAHLDWKDRLRILVSGNLMVQQAIKTDVPIARSRSTSDIKILRPGRRA